LTAKNTFPEKLTEKRWRFVLVVTSFIFCFGLIFSVSNFGGNQGPELAAGELRYFIRYYIIQILIPIILIIVKYVKLEDNFKEFSKRPDLKLSVRQYVEGKR